MTRKRARWLILLAVIALVPFGGAIVLVEPTWLFGPMKPGVAFEGDSDRLLRTIIVPTLDTPIPKGKNVIWCASFQIAWNHMRDDVVKAPLQIQNAEEVAGRLNRGKQSEVDLPTGTYYAAAGFAEKGVAEIIREKMAEHFPAVPAPPLHESGKGIIAYAYLEAQAKFEIPYFQLGEGMRFRDSTGASARVSCFGLAHRHEYAYYKLRGQIEVLRLRKDWEADSLEPPGFVLDLCKESVPNQLLLASIERKGTLSETLAFLEEKIGKETGGDFASAKEFGPRDELMVPDMVWEVLHHFRELEGEDKRLANTGFDGLYIAEAAQTTRFRLGRGGAELASEAKLLFQPIPTYFLLNHPFLVCMRKRGSKTPFFVMWVDNAELLSRR